MEFVSFLKEVKNCKIAKHNESQSVKYPRKGAINPPTYHLPRGMLRGK